MVNKQPQKNYAVLIQILCRMEIVFRVIENDVIAVDAAVQPTALAGCHGLAGSDRQDGGGGVTPGVDFIKAKFGHRAILRSAPNF